MSFRDKILEFVGRVLSLYESCAIERFLTVPLTFFFFPVQRKTCSWITVPLTVKTRPVLHQTGIYRETVQILTVHIFTVSRQPHQIESKPLTKDEKVSPAKSNYNIINVSI